MLHLDWIIHRAHNKQENLSSWVRDYNRMPCTMARFRTRKYTWLTEVDWGRTFRLPLSPGPLLPIIPLHQWLPLGLNYHCLPHLFTTHISCPVSCTYIRQASVHTISLAEHEWWWQFGHWTGLAAKAKKACLTHIGWYLGTGYRYFASLGQPPYFPIRGCTDMSGVMNSYEIEDKQHFILQCHNPRKVI